MSVNQQVDIKLLNTELETLKKELQASEAEKLKTHNKISSIDEQIRFEKYVRSILVAEKNIKPDPAPIQAAPVAKPNPYQQVNNDNARFEAYVKSILAAEKLVVPTTPNPVVPVVPKPKLEIKTNDNAISVESPRPIVSPKTNTELEITKEINMLDQTHSDRVQHQKKLIEHEFSTKQVSSQRQETLAKERKAYEQQLSSQRQEALAKERKAHEEKVAAQAKLNETKLMEEKQRLQQLAAKVNADKHSFEKANTASKKVIANTTETDYKSAKSAIALELQAIEREKAIAMQALLEARSAKAIAEQAAKDAKKEQEKLINENKKLLEEMKLVSKSLDFDTEALSKQDIAKKALANKKLKHSSQNKRQPETTEDIFRLIDDELQETHEIFLEFEKLEGEILTLVNQLNKNLKK